MAGTRLGFRYGPWRGVREEGVLSRKQPGSIPTMAAPSITQPPELPATAPSRTVRWVLSALLLFHVAAILIPPFTFATSSGPGQASPFAAPLMQLWRPYIDLLFLDHGYFFFAPNPGPSHLLRAKLEFSDGRPAQELTFPDRNVQWPRLRYHRHFMLAEQLHADAVPPEPPPEVAGIPEELERWRQARTYYELRRASFIRHLQAEHGADRVTLTRLEHAMLGPAEFQATRPPLNAADGYRELPEQSLPPTPAPLPFPQATP